MGRFNASAFEIRYVLDEFLMDAILRRNRLDTDVVVLRGSGREAASQLLKGVVALSLPAPMKVEDVHLRMTGLAKIACVLMRFVA